MAKTHPGAWRDLLKLGIGTLLKCSNRFWMRNWKIQIIELILLLCRGDIFALKWTYCALSYTIIIIIDRECKARLLPSSINCGLYISFPDTIQVQGTRNLLSKIRMWERILQSRFENVLSGRTGYLKLIRKWDVGI